MTTTTTPATERGEHFFELTAPIRPARDPEEIANALDDAGCDDATLRVARDGSSVTAAFSRESDNLAAAIASAIADIENALGPLNLTVVGDDLVYATEIAERVGRTRQSIDMLIRGERGPGGFPAPANHAGARNPLWRWAEVAAWWAGYAGVPAGDEARDAIIAAFNGALAARRALAGHRLVATASVPHLRGLIRPPKPLVPNVAARKVAARIPAQAAAATVDKTPASPKARKTRDPRRAAAAG